MLKELYKFKTDLENDGIIFSFIGPISHNVVEGIGSVLRNKMQTDDLNTNTSLKVFSIFVEQMQNVINYSVDKPLQNDVNSEISFGMIIVGQKESKYFIIGGNKVTKEQKERLEGSLEKISKMSKDELKEYYKQKRKLTSDEHSKGAGLGLIEMAKKSSEPIEYNFEFIDNNNFYFTIKTIV